jgi:hypothetical protein
MLSHNAITFSSMKCPQIKLSCFGWVIFEKICLMHRGNTLAVILQDILIRVTSVQLVTSFESLAFGINLIRP